MSLRSRRLSGSSAIRIAVTSSSYVERASTGASFNSSTSAVSRRSRSASPVEYCRLVPVRDEVVFFLGKVLGIRYVGLDGDDTLWLELKAKITGELDEHPSVVVNAQQSVE